MNKEKEFIPYEQALALKQLGFNESVFGTYGYNGENTTTYFPLETICRMEEYELSNFDIRNSNIGDDVSAPTFSQAFRWFRDKYGLFGCIDLHVSNPLHWYIRIDKISINDYVYHSEDENIEYVTYEEAELACLIKLIEIVKEKQ